MSLHTKFHPNRMKNAKVENFHYWAVLVGQAGRSKNGRSHFKHSVAVWKVIKDLCTKFQLNRMKIGQVATSFSSVSFTFSRMPARYFFSHLLVTALYSTPPLVL